MKKNRHILHFLLLGTILILAKAAPISSNQEIIYGCNSLGNPAADYCQIIMGYPYSVESEDDGSQTGLCTMPDGEICEQWDFYAGNCGSEYSWCDLAGFRSATVSDGADPYAIDYSVCLNRNGSEAGSVSELSGLYELLQIESVKAPNQKMIESHISAMPNPAGFPASFDWRNFSGENWITSVKNQSSCGSCWAFSTVGLAEAVQNIIAVDPTLDLNLSEQYLVSTCFGDGDCSGGIDVYAIEYIRDYGVPDEACYPYSSTDSLCSSRCSDYYSRLVYVPNAHNNWWDYTTDDMKTYISSYGPITITLGIGSEYGGGWDGEIYRCSNDSGINHSVLAVGYDDAGGYWIAKNSWGSSWNGDGYFKIGYGECGVQTSQISWVEASLPMTNFIFVPIIYQ